MSIVDATELQIGLRCGLHSGTVFSGIVGGPQRWQYDVWSDDVEVARCLEQSGQPG